MFNSEHCADHSKPNIIAIDFIWYFPSRLVEFSLCLGSSEVQKLSGKKKPLLVLCLYKYFQFMQRTKPSTNLQKQNIWQWSCLVSVPAFDRRKIHAACCDTYIRGKKVAKKDVKNSDQVSSLLAKGGLCLFFHLRNIYWVLAPVQKLYITHTCNSVFWNGLHSTHPTMIECPMYANTALCSEYMYSIILDFVFWGISSQKKGSML